MIRKIMYQKIIRLKKRGFSISAISKDIGLDRKTVRKYYHMSVNEYRDYLLSVSQRQKVMEPYHEEILEIYKIHEYKKLNMSSIYDYLEEKYGELNYSEKTLRNYIHHLIIIGKLNLVQHVRQYSKVPELPFGKQMQLDFGQFKLSDGTVEYIFAAILSASRYRYITTQQKPFTTENVIHHLLDTFEYFGGLPEELVIDQDSVLVVSENQGDIIYTSKFQDFIQEMCLSMYVCRKSDPETKGKIENTIKYVKYNFFKIRSHLTSDEVQRALPKWLTRRANGKISQATKRIPNELIEEERKSLRSIIKSIWNKDKAEGREDRNVDDKSYISVSASLYSVPNKYRNLTVEIFQTSTRLFIFDRITGKQVAEHELSINPGARVTDKSHFRAVGTSAEQLKEEILDLFILENWKLFCHKNYQKYPRYVRDQCLDAKRYFNAEIDEDVLEQSLQLCLETDQISFLNLHDTYLYFKNDEPVDTEHVSQTGNNCPHVAVNKRDLGIYTKTFLTNSQEVAHESL